MTVNTVSPAIISRAEFNLNAGQTKTPQLVRMDFGNLVTNGGFDTDIVGWTDSSETGGSVAWNASGIALSTGINNSEEGRAYQVVKTYPGSTCLLTATRSGANSRFDIDDSSSLGAGLFISTDAITDVSEAFVTPTSTTYINIRNRSGLSSTAYIDNVSLYEADPSDDAPWLRLPYGYSVGRTGMIVRDGVVLHPSDYTEIKDSGQTWIKPLVSPGASTEFSIWGSPSYAV